MSQAGVCNEDISIITQGNTMRAREDIEKKIGDKPITQIVGQPSKRDVTLLTKELKKMAASIKTALGGGKHGHLGLVIEEISYKDISYKGKTFDFPHIQALILVQFPLMLKQEKTNYRTQG